MRLTTHIRHVGFHHEVVVHAGILHLVGQCQGNAGQELSFVVRRRLAFIHHFFL